MAEKKAESGMAEARAYAAGTVVNALATGKGAAFAISLVTRVRVELGGKIVTFILNGEESRSEVAERVLRSFGSGGVVEVETEIPQGSGLGSSSAFMNALITACLKARGERLDARRILTANSRISLEMGISYTGAFDDASASLLGGLVVTDNFAMKILKWEELSSGCLILFPEWERGDVNLKEIRRDTGAVETALKEVLKGNIRQAMLHNSLHYCRLLGYPLLPVETAAKYDVSAGLSGNGPTFLALGDKRELKRLASEWRELGKVKMVEVMNEKAEDVEIPGSLFYF
jgi:shikimate kinase